MGEPLIRYRGVTKRFGETLVLDGIDLDVGRGEILTLMGPSGTGKTVLLKLLVGLLRCEAGRILFDTIDVTDLDERALAPVRQRIGFVFQGSALFDSLTVGENVGYALRVARNLPRAELRRRAEECLELVGLPGVAGRAPSEMSGGMRKRVAIARALVTRPEVLLYDEPTVGLDPSNVKLISDLIARLQRELRNTAVVVTHDRSVALTVSDRVALLAGRRLAWVGASEEARAAPPEVLKRFFSGERLEGS